MKNLLLCLLLSTTAFALPIGNPAEASLYKKGVFFDPCSVNPCNPLFMFVGGLDLRIGYYGDFTWGRKMEEFVFGSSENAYATMQMQTSAAYPVINIYNYMDVFATFGTSTIHVLRTAKETGRRGEAKFKATFSWSVGTHATLYRHGNFYIGGMGQYFRTQPHPRAYFNLGSGTPVSFNDTNETPWSEWQVAAGGSYVFKNRFDTSLVPYIAFKIDTGKLVLKGFEYTHEGISYQMPDLEPPKYFGWGIGCTLLNQDAMGVTVETRWLTEKALFVQGQMRF